jgi:hypothetical protein
MAVFGVRTKSDELVTSFMLESKERLKNSNLVKNPFRAEIVRLNVEDWAIEIEPVYFNFTPFFWIVAGAGYVLWGYSWWLWIPSCLGLLGIFWSKYFFFTMMKLGLRKKGYKGQVKLLSNKEMVRGIINGTERITGFVN